MPIFTCIIAFPVEGKLPKPLEMVALVVLSMGIMICVWRTDAAGSVHAMSLCLLATMSNSAMSCFAGKVMSGAVDALQLTFLTAPFSLLFLLPYFLYKEVRCLQELTIGILGNVSNRYKFAVRSSGNQISPMMPPVCEYPRAVQISIQRTLHTDLHLNKAMHESLAASPLCFRVLSGLQMPRLLVEVRVHADDTSSHFTSGLSAILIGTSVVAILYNYVHARLIHTTSATTTTVIGQVKIVGLVLLSAALLGRTSC